MRDHAHSTANVNTHKYGRSSKVIPLAVPDNQKRDEFTAFLNAWACSMKSETALTADEFKQLESLERMLITRNGFLANVISLCRTNRRQDSKIAVLALITFFSDNDENLCRLSIARMAQILCRKEDNIRDSINQLDSFGLIEVKRLNGLPNTYRPRACAGLCDRDASVIWFADAFSTKPAPRGRPSKKIYPLYTGGISDGDVNGRETQYPAYGSCGRQAASSCESSCEKTPPVVQKNPPRGGPQYFTKLIHSEGVKTNRGEPIRGTYAHTRTHAPARRGSCETSACNLEVC